MDWSVTIQAGLSPFGLDRFIIYVTNIYSGAQLARFDHRPTNPKKIDFFVFKSNC